MPTNPIPTIQKRAPGRFAGTNYVNELADVVIGQSPFGLSGQTDTHLPPWGQAYRFIFGDPLPKFGYYGGEIVRLNPVIDTSVTGVEATDWDAGVMDVVIKNLPEISTGTHRIPNGVPFHGFYMGQSNQDKLIIIECNLARAIRFERYDVPSHSWQIAYGDGHDATDPSLVWETVVTFSPCP